MRAALGQIGRIWVAIFIAYALLFQSVAAGSAAGPMDQAGVLCIDGKLDASGDMPAGHISHGDLCCILCQAPLQVTPTAEAEAVPVPLALPQRVAFTRPVAAPRLQPRLERPLQPRAPPVRT